ncbi:MAG TPA: LCP family protein, partial [Dehalococcoidia bacterium]|nr:LCP family protein [Dehalococcoidia bacterium]
ETTRTDTIFIMSIDPYSKTESVLSLPRDLLVDIPTGHGGYFKDRINVVYEYGSTGVIQYPGGGAALIKDTIKHNFGIPIDNYVVLDFESFIDIINELGGIDINVPEYTVDPSYQECYSCDFYVVEFEPGLQHMDGSTALAYSRIRFGSNDLHRIERQQLVMRATAEKASRINFLAPNKVTSLYGKYKDAVKTDISDFRLPGLAALGRGIPPDQIRMYSINDAVSDCYNCYAAVLIADWDKVHKIVQQMFLDSVVLAEDARIEIQNGTDIPGLANDVSEALTAQGLPADRISLADNAASDTKETLIYNLGNKEYTARKLAEWLGLPAARVITKKTPPINSVNGAADIIILAGTDATAGVR